MSDSLEITEKLLKDSFARRAPLSQDITLVTIDLRKDTHDVVQAYIRGIPAGQLVTDKTDSVTIARRLIPQSLQYGKEPSTLVKNMEDLGYAYGLLLLEVHSAIAHNSTIGLAAFMRKLDDTHPDRGTLPGDGHLFVAHRKVRVQGEGHQLASEPPA